MADIFGKKYSKAEILKRVGDISQIGSLKRYELKEGNEKGVEAVDLKTGTGFNFTVLLGRGMDISYAEYKGIPLCWRSSTGDVSADYFEPEGLGLLRSFFGGLLTTCGLTYLGAPCVDKGENLGLHGRISNIPAKNVYADGRWQEDDYLMWVQGKMRETRVFGENILLTRKISAKLGEPKLYIQDTVENLGYEKTEHMILYHFNIGFPILDEGAELLLPTLKVIPRDKEAEEGKENYKTFSSPISGYKEKVYYHQMKADDKRKVKVSLINGQMGIGIYMKYSIEQLPNFIQWKMMGEGIYVLGLEPANCLVEGRAKERERGTLKFLEPGEVRKYQIELGIIDNRKESRLQKNSMVN